MTFDRKAPRNDFVRFQCANCCEVQVVVAPVRWIRIRCQFCPHYHVIHPEERSTTPHGR